MEELSKIAMGYYQATTDDLQKLAHDFFRAMDNDGDGKIDLREFLEFMKEEGHVQMTNPFFFSQLDVDGNGTLDFVEVMTLYYIVKSGRPFCNCCKKFITSTYLTCIGCFEDRNEKSFYLCLDCYVMQKCDHTHDDMSRFLDNYAFLDAMTKSKLSQTRSRPSETVPVPEEPPSGHHTWTPSLSMGHAPPSGNHTILGPSLSMGHAPPSGNHTLSQSLSMGHGPPSGYHTLNQSLSMGHAPRPTASQQLVAPSVHNHTWIQNNYYPVHYPRPPLQVQQHPQRQQWKVALGVLNVAITTATLSGFCSIL